MASYISRMLSNPNRKLATTAFLLSWTPVAIFLYDNAYNIAHVTGPSMNPLFNTPENSPLSTGSSMTNPISRDTILLSKYNPASNLRRGDVIAFWSPVNPERRAVKRVVAVAGDQVDTRRPYPFRTETVPEGHVWVEGDNPEGRFSRDSNEYGPVAKSLVYGKVVARLWPNPRWIQPEKWEEKEGQRRNERVRRNMGIEIENEIFRR